jgi:hypothetical protein
MYIRDFYNIFSYQIINSVIYFWRLACRVFIDIIMCKNQKDNLQITDNNTTVDY